MASPLNLLDRLFYIFIFFFCLFSLFIFILPYLRSSFLDQLIKYIGINIGVVLLLKQVEFSSRPKMGVTCSMFLVCSFIYVHSLSPLYFILFFVTAFWALFEISCRESSKAQSTDSCLHQETTGESERQSKVQREFFR